MSNMLARPKTPWKNASMVIDLPSNRVKWSLLLVTISISLIISYQTWVCWALNHLVIVVILSVSAGRKFGWSVFRLFSHMVSTSKKEMTNTLRLKCLPFYVPYPTSLSVLPSPTLAPSFFFDLGHSAFLLYLSPSIWPPLPVLPFDLSYY